MLSKNIKTRKKEQLLLIYTAMIIIFIIAAGWAFNERTEPVNQTTQQVKQQVIHPTAEEKRLLKIIALYEDKEKEYKKILVNQNHLSSKYEEMISNYEKMIKIQGIKIDYAASKLKDCEMGLK